MLKQHSYGEIEEEIYMEVPVGMKEVFSDPEETNVENTCYQLLKTNIWFMPISKTILEKVCQ